jgi:hypothetical protein
MMSTTLGGTGKRLCQPETLPLMENRVPCHDSLTATSASFDLKQPDTLPSTIPILPLDEIAFFFYVPSSTTFPLAVVW